ncbi:MAG: hypothetical protein E7253_03275 [Lachnospiraceae bacterium]|nr:hypothetical protein [Lachnospiraceae bacterium]
MNKKIHSLLALIVAACMLVNITLPAVAAVPATDEKNEKLLYTVTENSFYVSLGDSTVTGLGLEGYGNYGYRVKVPEAYPYRVAKSLGLDPETQYEQLACGGLRVEDILYVLDDTFEADAYTYNSVESSFNRYTGGLEQTRKLFAECLSRADLISISAGGNSLGTYASFIMNHYEETGIVPQVEWERYLNQTELNKLQNKLKSLDKLLKLAGISEEERTYAILRLQCMLYGYYNITKYFDKTIERIREYAPDASLVIVGLYNTMQDVYIENNGVRIDIDSLMQGITDYVNTVLRECADRRENAIFVDAMDVETFNYVNVIEKGASFSFAEYMNHIQGENGVHNDHATANGHAYIAEQILKKIICTTGADDKEAEEKPIFPDNNMSGQIMQYVSLGDSMSDGAGLPGYVDSEDGYCYGHASYSNRFAQWLQEQTGFSVVHTPLARIGMTAGELYRMLAEESVDIETNSDNNHMDGTKIEEYQNAVKNADTISLGIGNDTFGTYFSTYLTDALQNREQTINKVESDMKSMIAECRTEIQSVIQKLLSVLYNILEISLSENIDDGDPTVISELEVFADAVIYVSVRYLVDYTKTIEAILHMNPDAELILISLMDMDAAKTQNIYPDLAETDISVVSVLNSIIEPLNVYVAALPAIMQMINNPLYQNAVFYYAESADIEWMFTEEYGLVPSEQGHEALFQAVKKSYASDYEARTQTMKNMVTMLENYLLYTPDEVKVEVSHYVSIGDASVTETAGKEEVTTFSQQLAQELKLKDEQFIDLGQEGVTTADLFKIVEEHTDNIQNADLITIGVSINAMLVESLKAAKEDVLQEYDWNKYLPEEAVLFVEEKLSNLELELRSNKELEAYVPMIVALVEGLGYRYVEFAFEYPELVKEIHGYADDDAQVILIGMHNPMKGLSFEGINIGEYVEYLTALGNIHLNAYSLISPNTLFISAPEVDTFAKHITYHNNLLFLLNLVNGSHFNAQFATEEGHTYIKDQILDAVDIIGTWGDVNRDGKVTSKDAVELLKYLVHLTDASELDLQVADLNGDDKVNSKDAVLILQYCIKLITKFPVAG